MNEFSSDSDMLCMQKERHFAVIAIDALVTTKFACYVTLLYGNMRT